MWRQAGCVGGCEGVGAPMGCAVTGIAVGAWHCLFEESHEGHSIRILL